MLNRALRNFLILVIPILFACALSGGKKSGFDLISIGDEIRMGKKIAQEISRQFKLVEDKQVLDYFQEMGSGIARNSDWSGLSYHISILNTSEFLAFSVLGGHIYISRGLIERVDYMSEVAGIIAHEIGHVASRHGSHQLMETYGLVVSAQNILGESSDLYGDIVSNLFKSGSVLDYGEKDELKADELAVQYMWKTGYDPSGFLSTLEKLHLLEIEDETLVARYQLTHPRVYKRINRVSKTIDSLPYKSGLKMDSDEFQKIKQRLKEIR